LYFLEWAWTAWSRLGLLGLLGAALDFLELLLLAKRHLDPGVLNVGVKGERVNP
jgi:hypothetical protein